MAKKAKLVKEIGYMHCMASENPHRVHKEDFIDSLLRTKNAALKDAKKNNYPSRAKVRIIKVLCVYEEV